MLALIRHYEQFQSTLSMRRATLRLVFAMLGLPQFQSTLSMRRATSWWTTRYVTRTISIHALHEESDRKEGNHDQHSNPDFNPRSP